MPATTVDRAMISVGSTGADVVALQEWLRDLGYGDLLGDYGPNGDGVDGHFGSATEAAVEAFQTNAGIAVDGIVGPQTWGALQTAIASAGGTSGSAPAPGGGAAPVPVGGGGAPSSGAPPQNPDGTVVNVPIVESSPVFEYQVVWGDTLSGIAQRFDTTVEAIAAENGIANPNLIQEGQVLRVPSGTYTPPGSTPNYLPAGRLDDPDVIWIAIDFDTHADAQAIRDAVAAGGFVGMDPDETLTLGEIMRQVQGFTDDIAIELSAIEGITGLTTGLGGQIIDVGENMTHAGTVVIDRAALAGGYQITNTSYSAGDLSGTSTAGLGGSAPPPGSNGATPPTVSTGSRSPIVGTLQAALALLGYSPGRPDNIFGPLTQGAVERFQTTQGIGVDGVVGPVTWGALARALGTRGGPEAAALIRQMNEGGSSIRNTAATTGGSTLETATVWQFQSAIKTIESSNNPRATGPQTRYGLPGGYYQFVPDTWRRAIDRYAPEHGRWRNTHPSAVPPEIQDAVATAWFSGLHDRYGSWELVAVAHFAGEGRADRANRDGSVYNLRDSLGTSVAGYVSKVRAALPVDNRGFTGVGEHYGYAGAGPNSSGPPRSTFNPERVLYLSDVTGWLQRVSRDYREQLALLSADGLLAGNVTPAQLQLEAARRTVLYGDTNLPPGTIAQIDARTWVYIVNSGDQLASIAAAFDVSWRQLATANGIDPDRIDVGQAIVITNPGDVPTRRTETDWTQINEFDTSIRAPERNDSGGIGFHGDGPIGATPGTNGFLPGSLVITAVINGRSVQINPFTIALGEIEAALSAVAAVRRERIDSVGEVWRLDLARAVLQVRLHYARTAGDQRFAGNYAPGDYELLLGRFLNDSPNYPSGQSFSPDQWAHLAPVWEDARNYVQSVVREARPGLLATLDPTDLLNAELRAIIATIENRPAPAGPASPLQLNEARRQLAALAGSTTGQLLLFESQGLDLGHAVYLASIWNNETALARRSDILRGILNIDPSGNVRANPDQLLGGFRRTFEQAEIEYRQIQARLLDIENVGRTDTLVDRLSSGQSHALTGLIENFGLFAAFSTAFDYRISTDGAQTRSTATIETIDWATIQLLADSGNWDVLRSQGNIVRPVVGSRGVTNTEHIYGRGNWVEDARLFEEFSGRTLDAATRDQLSQAAAALVANPEIWNLIQHMGTGTKLFTVTELDYASPELFGVVSLADINAWRTFKDLRPLVLGDLDDIDTANEGGNTDGNFTEDDFDAWIAAQPLEPAVKEFLYQAVAAGLVDQGGWERLKELAGWSGVLFSAGLAFTGTGGLAGALFLAGAIGSGAVEFAASVETDDPLGAVLAGLGLVFDGLDAFRLATGGLRAALEATTDGAKVAQVLLASGSLPTAVDGALGIVVSAIHRLADGSRFDAPVFRALPAGSSAVRLHEVAHTSAGRAIALASSYGDTVDHLIRSGLDEATAALLVRAATEQAMTAGGLPEEVWEITLRYFAEHRSGAGVDALVRAVELGWFEDAARQGRFDLGAIGVERAHANFMSIINATTTLDEAYPTAARLFADNPGLATFTSSMEPHQLVGRMNVLGEVLEPGGQAMADALLHDPIFSARVLEIATADGARGIFSSPDFRAMADTLARAQTHGSLNSSLLTDRLIRRQILLQQMDGGLRRTSQGANEWFGALAVSRNLHNPKGQWGEMHMDSFMAAHGFVPIHRDPLVEFAGIGTAYNSTGIDGIYFNPQTGRFAIGEAKTGAAARPDSKILGDGTRQMELQWILNRLEAGVEPGWAPAVEAAINAGNVDQFLFHLPEVDSPTVIRLDDRVAGGTYSP